MKFGDQLRGQIEDVDDKGRGFFSYALPEARDGARTVVVPFTVPGDEVTVTFVKRDQGKWLARLDKIECPSKDRVDAACPHAGVCGGCLWQHLAYDAQLEIKRRQINAAFAQAGFETRVDSVVPCPQPLFYRNRMDYVIGWKGEVGLKEYGSWNRYLNLSTCLLLDEDTPRILETVRELMRELELAPWDARRHEGLMRYVVIRLGRNTKERLIHLVVKDLTKIDEHAREIICARLAPFSTSLFLGENPEVTDLSLSKTLVLLHGNEFLTEEVNGLRYRIHPNAFFQTNTEMAGVLQNTVQDFVAGATNVLDLYCGLGFLGIACAKRGAMVYGHELDAQAIELAKENARLNNVNDRTAFGAGPVEDLNWGGLNPDAVIVDPPRAGLHPRALAMLVEKNPPLLVYVSCNYRKLVEELKTLTTVYDIERIAALDLFPQTPHVEVLVKMTRRTS